MDAEYSLLVQTVAGDTLAQLPRVSRCVYARTQNDGGEMTLVLPGDYYNLNLFAPFNRILVLRQVGAGQPYVDLETPWFITRGPDEILDNNGMLSWEIGCTDALGLICEGANVAYNDNNAYTYKLDNADDMMKAIMRENRGSLATDTARDMSGSLSIAPDNGLAPSIRFGSFARQQVLSVLQDIADASANDDTPTWLGFDIVQVSTLEARLEFRTYVGQRGVDHRYPSGTPPLVLSADNGTLANVRVSLSYKDAASYIYAGGTVTNDVRSVATDQNTSFLSLSPFARIEKYVDGSNIQDATSLAAFAKAELRKARPKRTFTADIVETQNAMRGVHWDYGDFVTANWRTQTYDARVNKIAVTLEPATGGGLKGSCSVQMTVEESISG